MMVEIKKLILAIFLLVFAGCNGSHNGNDKNSSASIDETLIVAKDKIRAGDYEGAVKLIDSLKKEGRTGRAYYYLAIAKVGLAGRMVNGVVKKNKYSLSALGDMQRAIKLEPTEIDYLAEFALLASDLEYDEVAVEKFEVILENVERRREKKYRYMVTNYAMSLQRLGRGNEGIAEYKESLNLNPDDERLMFAYISGLAAYGNHETMTREYEIFTRKYGYSSELNYLLCWESLTMHRRDYGRQCLFELINNPKATLEKRVSASRILRGTAREEDVPVWKGK